MSEAKAAGAAVEVVGQRAYLAGLPFAAKDRAKKELGAKWDGGRKQWWVGRAKADEAAAFLAALAAAPPAEPAAEDVSGCRAYAQVMHKGRRYYVIAETADVTRCRLTTLDGMAPFWVDCAACELVKRYEGRPRGWKGGRFGRQEVEYPTIGSLRAFRDRQADPATARGQCVECGHWGPRGERCQECHEGHHA